MLARGKERFKTTNLLFLMLKFPMDSGRHFFWSTKIPRSRFWIKQNPSQKVAWSCSVWGLTVRLTSEATITFWIFGVQIHPKKKTQKKTAKIIKVNWWLLLNLSNFVLKNIMFHGDWGVYHPKVTQTDRGKRWWYFPTQPKLQGSELGKKNM